MKQLIDNYQEYVKRGLLEGKSRDFSDWEAFTCFILEFSIPSLVSSCATLMNLEHANLVPSEQEEEAIFLPQNLPFYENIIKKEKCAPTRLLEKLRIEIRKQKRSSLS